MAIIRNISKLIVPAYNKGPKDVINYINEQAWSTGADVGTISINGEFYSVMGSGGLLPFPLSLQATITSSTISIPVTNPLGNTSALSSLAPSGYVLIGSEIIQYTSITTSGSSVSGYDELTMPSTAYRGVKGTTAAGHTGGLSTLISEILFGTVSNIEYNQNTEVFNVWTQTTQIIYQGYILQSSTVTTHLIPCPENTVTFFEVDGVAS
jgi:hypothetical protein